MTLKERQTLHCLSIGDGNSEVCVCVEEDFRFEKNEGYRIKHYILSRGPIRVPLFDASWVKVF